MKVRTLFALVLLFTAGAAGFSLDLGLKTGGDAAIIQLSGGIQPTSGGFPSSGGLTPADVRELNERALNQGADAIIYEINSGGGGVVASKEIKREIESVEVPTVCRFRDITASGAYLASLGCDHLVADSASFTGSIGVRGSYLEFSGLLDRLGVERVNVSSGKYKTIGSPYVNITRDELEILRNMSSKIHGEFVSTVEEERNLTQEEVDEIKTGRPILGRNARELGLVDSLGGRRTAVNQAEELTGTGLETFKVEKRSGFDFLSLLTSNSFLGELDGKIPLVAGY